MSHQNIPPEPAPGNSAGDGPARDEPPPTSIDPAQTPDGPSQDSPTTLKKQTKTTPMEVHHHGHLHTDKKWKEYLFQFLMLFLAITLGFFVENQREHYIENQRAKVFAKLLVNDLSIDTAELNRAQRVWGNIVTASDSLAVQLNEANFRHVPGGKIYYYEYWSGWRWSIISRDATLQQLKNSGSLRYLGDAALILKILDYEEAIKLTYLLQNKYEAEKIDNWKLVQSVFDQSVFDTLESIKGAARDSTNVLLSHSNELDSFLNKDFPLKTDDKAVLFQLKNWAQNTSRNYKVLLKDVVSTKRKAIDAIETLKQKYHLN